MAAPDNRRSVWCSILRWQARKKAMKEMGFTDFYDVGLGGDMTAAYEAEEWLSI